MSYEKKYIKYKNKYISLKNNLLMNKNIECDNFKDYIVKPQNRKILILYIGGTFGMENTSQKFFINKDIIQEKIKNNNNFISKYEIKEYDPLIDSSDISIDIWNKIIKDIANNYNNYDGFIIIHGTDTMAYTASALSFALNNLDKTIVITGSQIPITEIKNDAIDNLISSLLLVSNFNIPEVLIVFDNKIIRGNRSKKISSNKINAFASPNFENIGLFDNNILPKINYSILLKFNKKEFYYQLYNKDIYVDILIITPGYNFINYQNNIKNNNNIKGIIIQTYGIGNGPASNKDFLNLLKLINEKKIIILSISQCIEGIINTEKYLNGIYIEKYNVINGSDMTLETGYCKLLFLLQKYNNILLFEEKYNLIKKELLMNIKGELTQII